MSTPLLEPRSIVRVHVLAILLALSLSSCGSHDGTSEPPRPDPPPSPTRPCDTFTRAECLRSTHCTLEHVTQSQYRCRPDEGPCEVGIQQSDRRACEAQGGCRWDPGACYCPFNGYGRTAVPDPPNEGAACACGGGPPARCLPAQ